MKHRVRAALAAICLFGCRDVDTRPGLGADCGVQDPCRDPYVCAIDGTCSQPCSSNEACSATELCSPESVCLPRRLKLARCFGDSEDQIPTDVAIGPDDGIVIVGDFVGAIDFGGGPLVAEAEGDKTDIFVAKLDATGQHVWSRRFGGPGSDTALSVAVDTTGAVVVTGSIQDTVDFGGGPLHTPETGTDIFVAKLDAAGSHVFSKSFGVPGRVDLGRTVAIGPLDSILAGGYFGGCWETPAVVDFGGGDLICPKEMACAYVVRFDATGAHRFSRTFLSRVGETCVGGGPKCPLRSTPFETCTQGVTALSFGADGSYVLAGNFSETVFVHPDDAVDGARDDVFVAAFGSSDRPLWASAYGGTGVEVFGSLARESGGGVAIAGQAKGESVQLGGASFLNQGGWDGFVAAFDEDGAHRYSFAFGGAGDDAATAVELAGDGRLLAAGTFVQSVDIGLGAVTSLGGVDSFLAVLDESGLPLAQERLGGPLDDSIVAMAVSGADVVLGFDGREGVSFAGETFAAEAGRNVCVARMPIAAIGQ